MTTDNQDKQTTFSPGFENDLHRRILAFSRSSILWSVMVGVMFKVLSLFALVASRLTNTDGKNHHE